MSAEKICSKKIFNIGDGKIFKNKRNSKKNNNNGDTLKETTTIDSIEYSYKLNNYHNKRNKLNLSELQQTGTLISTEDKFDKYKKLENPFTIPNIPRNLAKERRSKIIYRINRERMAYQSKSFDNAVSKNKFKKKNVRLSNKLFADE